MKKRLRKKLNSPSQVKVGNKYHLYFTKTVFLVRNEESVEALKTAIAKNAAYIEKESIPLPRSYRRIHKGKIITL